MKSNPSSQLTSMFDFTTTSLQCAVKGDFSNPCFFR
jgi:hypothetical protein